MSQISRTWTLNGVQQELRFSSLSRLLDVLRGDGSSCRKGSPSLLSVKEGCGEGECGTCTVVIDGELQLGCMVMAAQVDDGSELLTAEGLEGNALGRVLMDTFDEAGAVQCGYCTPGMLLSAFSLLHHAPTTDPDTIREALAGSLCRCTGYGAIVEAVAKAADRYMPPRHMPNDELANGELANDELANDEQGPQGRGTP